MNENENLKYEDVIRSTSYNQKQILRLLTVK